MPAYVALLRGINLGAKRRIPMPALRGGLLALGFFDVVTYIQSGDVVFSTGATTRQKLETAISERIRSESGLEVSVTIRSSDELLHIRDSNPFMSGGADPKQLHVTFLNTKPYDEAIARLEGIMFPPDDFRMLGEGIFVRYTNGVSNSPINFALNAHTLGVAGMTSRNWRTVTRLTQIVSVRS